VALPDGDEAVRNHLSAVFAKIGVVAVSISARAVRVRGETNPRRTAMKQYVLTVYQPDGPPPEDVDIDQIERDIRAVSDDLKATGGWVFSGGLAPATSSTVVRANGGDVVMTDGPYVEGKEHVGGLTIIAAEDLDGALEWAGRFAAATTLPIEVRPLSTERG